MPASAYSSTDSLVIPHDAPPAYATHKPKKDYAAAFASLQSSYGAGGLAPRVPVQQPRQRQRPSPTPLPVSPPSYALSTSSSSTSSARAPSSTTSNGQKDYAAAFASLQSSFGASGMSPVVPTPSQRSRSSSQERDGAPSSTPRRKLLGLNLRTSR